MMHKFTYLGLGVAAALLGTSVSASTDDPLLRPIAASYAARWLTPQEPIHVHGNSYLVGFAGLNVGLIRTDAGLILIDGALPQAVSTVEANIRRLGFRVKDIKLILSTEPHFDHAGGLAALARDSGATVVASASAAEVLRAGRSAADDPQAGSLAAFPAVKRLRVVRDGQSLRLGDTIVTAHATPGHTAGSMSWTWQSCEDGKCLAMVFASSLNPISADGYRFSDLRHRSMVAAFRRTFDVVRALPCDLLLTPHPDQSGGDVKFAQFQRSPRPNPFVDPQACRAYADKHEALLDARLAEEEAERR